MVSDSIFPTEADFQSEIYQADDIPSTLRHLKDTIINLNNTPPSLFTDVAIDWVDQTLPLIWPLVINLEHPSRSSIREASSLNFEILKLIQLTRYNPHLVLPLVTFFDFCPKTTKTYEIERLSQSKIDELFKFEDHGRYLSKEKPPTSSIITSLVEQLFTSEFFKTAIDYIKSNEFSIESLCPILTLFLEIEPLISHTYVSLLLPFFMETSIHMLSNNNLTENCLHIATFLTDFSPCMPELLNRILTLFCELSSHGSVQVRYSLVSKIIQIVETTGPGDSANIIKNAMIGAATDPSAHHSLLREVFQFLPSLTSFVNFSEDDLGNLIKTTTSASFTCIIRIIPNISTHLDHFAQIILDSGIFFPALYCTLIERVESLDISRTLFQQLLSDPSRLANYDLSTLELNDNVRQHMKDIMDSTDDINYLKSLSYLFLSSPQNPVLPSFLMKIIKLSVQNRELFTLLYNFTDIINKFDSKNFILNVFNTANKRLQSYTSDSYTAEILGLLTEWIDNTKNVPADHMIENLRSLNFQQCISAVFPLINFILKRTKNEYNVKNFLFKIIYDTTSPRHAEWVIRELFGVIHKDRDSIQQVVEILIRHLGDPLKCSNAIYLIYQAALYEVDYFRLKQKTFGFVQKIVMKYDPPKTFFVSLHPFHSTKRIFLELALEFHMKINQLSVTEYKGSQEISISSNFPLTSIGISPFEPIKLDAAKTNDVKETQEIWTPFLDELNNQTYIGLLYQLIQPDNEYSEVIFLLLTLFQPFNLCSSSQSTTKEHLNEHSTEKLDMKSDDQVFQLPAPTNFIQALFHEQCDNPQNYAEYSHIYPYALKVYADTGNKLNEDEITQVFLCLIKNRYDAVSLAIACAALWKLGDEYCFNSQIIQECLIETNQEIIRQTFLGMISPEIDRDVFISLLPAAIRKENRNKTKQFFMWMKRMNYPSEIYLPFFHDLVQYEFSHYSDIDETYIALLDLVPVNEDTITLTLKRLFAPPTCHNLQQPFVQTLESWKASLTFLLNSQSISQLNTFLLNLPQVPSLSMKLSDDFTYKGRSGIVNLGSTCYVNSLLQILNVLPNISMKLINKQSNDYSPFVARLRELLAELKFVRGCSLSIRPLVDTISNFNTSQQEDAEEFLLMIVNAIHDNGSPEITQHLQGEITTLFLNGDEVVSSTKENFYYLPLPIKGLNRLDEALIRFSQDSKIFGYTIEGVNDKVDVFQKSKITKWPDYLCIQLQRWDFPLETQERQKLVHEFDFPIELDTCKIDVNSNKKYTLKGVIVHQGSAEQGHYFAIVRDGINDWYVCNDQSIEYFEISHLPEWAFGMTDDKLGSSENIGTGYLLFYEQEGIDQFSANVPPDLEDKLNQENQVNWPSEIFYSETFASYAMDLLLLSTHNEQAIQLALNVMFRIAATNEKIIEDWIYVFSEHIFNHQELCHLFFEFIDGNIGKSLSNIVMLSESLPKLIVFVFQQIRDSTKPLLTLLNNFNFSSNRRVINTVLQVIPIACKSLKVDWANEDEALHLMVQYLSIEMQRDFFKMVSKQHCLALNSVMSLLYEVLMKKGCIPAILTTFQIENLNRIYSSAKKSESFQKLMTKVNLLRPDIFIDIGEASPSVKQLLAPIISVAAASENAGALDIYTDFIWESFPNFLFNSEEDYRREAASLAIRLLGEVEPGVEKFFEEALVGIVKQKPCFPDPSAIPLYFIGLIPRACQMIMNTKKIGLCDHFLDVLIRLCRVLPESTGLYFHWVAMAFLSSKDLKLLQIVHDLISYDTTLIDNFNEEDIEEILSSDCASKESVHLLFFFKNNANGSSLSGACVEYYLKHSFDQGANLLIEMIKDGLIPGEFEIPEQAENIAKLKFANVLWDALPEKREQLSNYMLSAIRLAKPFKLLSHCPTVRKTCDILRTYCNELLEEVVGHTVL
ncbi:hypothetical protein TRFO_07691 [Tritrichomonas foetus]|uniref:USP domain-containing protein n=1 Tax=Tritrichomonas foetus TaxID=1144522 RepID=A0A1J4JUT9_9EUKA|nr:hypothetical protein TRFO_07691 [Tritrichomonas foetus]|eukprot:OHT01021.1 hypothetical protein TRFO_07691 [Tritrichomonas foetus]